MRGLVRTLMGRAGSSYWSVNLSANCKGHERESEKYNGVEVVRMHLGGVLEDTLGHGFWHK